MHNRYGLIDSDIFGYRYFFIDYSVLVSTPKKYLKISWRLFLAIFLFGLNETRMTPFVKNKITMFKDLKIS